jgi:hypothetical protein
MLPEELDHVDFFAPHSALNVPKNLPPVRAQPLFRRMPTLCTIHYIRRLCLRLTDIGRGDSKVFASLSKARHDSSKGVTNHFCFAPRTCCTCLVKPNSLA